MRKPTFVPSRPGAWELDTTHFQRPATRYMVERCLPAMVEGSREAFERYGVLLDRLDMLAVDGFVYTMPRPVGAPERATGTPPWLVFKLLTTLHPAIRRRLRTLDESFAQRRWRADLERWDREVAPATRAANQALQEVDPAGLDDAGLWAHLEACDARARAMFTQHHRYDVTCTMAPAVFLASAQDWTGLPVAELVRVFAGHSPLSAGVAPELEQLVTLLRATPGALAGEPAAALAALRGRGDGLAAAFAAFERAYALRALEGYDLDSPALGELPGLVFTLLQAAVEAPRAAQQAEDVAAALRARVPAAHQAAFDEWLAEARLAYRLRDERALTSDAWAMGLMRRAAMEQGRRLAAAGRLAAPELFLEAGWEEMRALALGTAGPSSEELAERAAFRHAYCPADAPAWLGAEPAGPPPAAWMPTANARITVRGTTLLLDAMFKNPPAGRDGEALRGLPASPGVAEGPARVIRGPQDFQRVRPGDVLVARTTNTTFNGILPLLAGLVTDRGGLLAHSAIVAREYGIPGVVGTTDATAMIPDGARIRVDGTAGTVLVLGPAVPEQAAEAEAPVAQALVAVPLEGPQVPLALAEAEAERWYGGKAVQLGAALRAGLPVPEGWALPVALVERVAAGDAGAIALLRALPLAGPVAVRSSAVGEDSAEASFAGQHRTVLGVVGADAVVAAVAEVWASTRTDAALAYRRKLGLEASPCCAVVVQPMVAADVAGVLFSRNPLTGADERVVEAAWGLGEAVVEGLVTPDRFRLTRDGAVLERSPGAKDLAVRLHADGGTAEVPVDPAQAAALCLDDAKLAALAGLAARCEAVYGGLQDLEWAFAGDRLFLLQRRAMTAVVA